MPRRLTPRGDRWFFILAGVSAGIAVLTVALLVTALLALTGCSRDTSTSRPAARPAPHRLTGSTGGAGQPARVAPVASLPGKVHQREAAARLLQPHDTTPPAVAREARHSGRTSAGSAASKAARTGIDTSAARHLISERAPVRPKNAQDSGPIKESLTVPAAVQTSAPTLNSPVPWYGSRWQGETASLAFAVVADPNPYDPTGPPLRVTCGPQSNPRPPYSTGQRRWDATPKRPGPWTVESWAPSWRTGDHTYGCPTPYVGAPCDTQVYTSAHPAGWAVWTGNPAPGVYLRISEPGGAVWLAHVAATSSVSGSTDFCTAWR